MTSRRVLIAGYGYVGRRLGEQLSESGHKVWGLSRNPQSAAPIEGLPADLLDRASLDLPPDLDAVVYMAAADGPGAEAYQRAYVQGVENLIEALIAQGQSPRRVIYTSSTGVYAEDQGGWVDEESPTPARHPRTAALLEGERLWQASPWQTVIVRFSGLYGPGRTRLIQQIQQGRGAEHDAQRWTNRLHRDDAAGFVAHLLQSRECEPLYLGSDDRPAFLHEVQRFIADTIGLPAPAGPPADAPVRNKRCRNAKMRQSGYRLRFPSFEEGYASLIEGVS